MKATDFIKEAAIGTEPKRPAREGSRPARGHDPEARYTPAPAKPFRNPPGFNKQGTGVGNELAQQTRAELAKKKQPGVAEGADQVKKVFKDKSGKPVGEIGIDPESSPGNGKWYVHHYATGYSVVGFDSAAEAKRELMYVHKHPGAVEGHESTLDESIAQMEAELAEASREFKGPHGTLDIERKPGRTIVKRRDYTDRETDIHDADKFSNMKLRGQGQGSVGSKNVSSLNYIPTNTHHHKPDYGYDINDKTDYEVDYEPEFEMDEEEGTPEGVPHLTKELLQHIIDQVGTEGAHAICKSIQWGDGAAKELLHLITKHLKHDASQIAESIQEFWVSEHGKASRELCKSSKPDADLGASMLSSCKSQGLRARDGDKSHKLGKTAKSRVKVGGHRIKGRKYGGPLPDWS